MTGKLVITHGLPGSGKSTWAEQQVAESPETRIRVNRDDIRTIRFGAKYHKQDKYDKRDESEVTRIQQELLREGFRKGKTVYSDDTNLNQRLLPNLIKLARDYGAEIEQEYFNVPVEECKRRNHARGKAGGRLVPDFVIDGMAERGYSADGNIKEFIISDSGSVWAVDRMTPGMKLIEDFNTRALEKYPFLGAACNVVDIDGTLANNARDADIAFGGPGKKKNFPHFYRSIKNAPVNGTVRDLANMMRDEDRINQLVMTGRSDECAEELLDFIERSGTKISMVMAKREGDFRSDSEYKPEALKMLQSRGLIVVHAIDDRPRSIAHWEKAGVLVSRVDYHEPVDPSTGPREYPEPFVDTIYASGYCIRCGSALKSGGNIGPKCRTKI